MRRDGAVLFAVCFGIVAVAILSTRLPTVRVLLPVIGLYAIAKLWRWFSELKKGAANDSAG